MAVSSMSFAELGLNPILVRSLRQMGYRRPRPIQAEAIGPALAGRDVIGLAATGTGKTAAFAVPIAHHLLASRPGAEGGAARRGRGRPRVAPAARLRALVLCPTRELAQQVEAETARVIAGTMLRATCVFGKVGMRPQIEALQKGVDILVGTPGRVRDLLDADALTLAHARHVVIDEADRMMDMGFRPQVAGILQRTPPGRQTLLFTATMPPVVEALAREFLDDPVRLEIGRHTRAAGHVRQHLVPVEDRLKVPMLLHLLGDGHDRGVLVFCRTRRRVGWVGTALMRNGIRAGMIHGDRTQAQRRRALDRFAEGRLDVVVATDVAARGLHIPAVRTVINYDLPLAPEEYVHRVGRAGHGGGFGESFTMLGRADEGRWRAIERAAALDLEPETLPGFEPPAWARPARSPAKKAPPGKASGQDGASDGRRDRGKGKGKGKGTKAAPRGGSGSRGRLKRRARRSRAIGKEQKPGTGVRRSPDSPRA
jgi:ATP-dependent RNA helicase RhlE